MSHEGWTPDSRRDRRRRRKRGSRRRPAEGTDKNFFVFAGLFLLAAILVLAALALFTS